MAIGLLLGRSSPGESRDPCYAAVQTFVERFTQRFGSIICPELIGVDISIPQGRSAFDQLGKINDCTNYVGESVRMVLELVDEKEK